MPWARLSNSTLGYSVAEILRASGRKVYKTQIINDRGIHICKSMLAWQKFGQGETPESTGLKGDKLVGNYYVAFDQAYKKEVEALVAGGMDEKDASREAPILKEAQELLRRWEAVLTGLETDPMSLAGQLDWVAKYRLLAGYRERHGLEWSDARLAAMDLQYHDLRPGKSLFARLDMERIIDDDEIESGVTLPPEDTRAYFRGTCLARFAESIVAANWDSMVFDVGEDPLRRVPMMEPGRGSRAHVGTLLTEAKTAAELLDRLGS